MINQSDKSNASAFLKVAESLFTNCSNRDGQSHKHVMANIHMVDTLWYLKLDHFGELPMLNADRHNLGNLLPIFVLFMANGAANAEIQVAPVREVQVTPVREIQPTGVREVQPTGVREMQPPVGVREVQPVGVRETQVTGVHQTPPNQKPPDMPIGAIFERVWRLNVPGAVWTTTNQFTGDRFVHVAPGSGELPHQLKISANGTYIWVAFGETIRGRWVRRNDAYPLTLVRAYEGKNWNVRTEGQELRLWDGKGLSGQFYGR